MLPQPPRVLAEHRQPRVVEDGGRLPLDQLEHLGVGADEPGLVDPPVAVVVDTDCPGAGDRVVPVGDHVRSVEIAAVPRLERRVRLVEEVAVRIEARPDAGLRADDVDAELHRVRPAGPGEVVDELHAVLVPQLPVEIVAAEGPGRPIDAGAARIGELVEAGGADEQPPLVQQVRREGRGERRRQLQVPLVQVKAGLGGVVAADVEIAADPPIAGQPHHERLRAGEVEVGPDEEIVVAVRRDREAPHRTGAIHTGERGHGLLRLVLERQEAERLVAAQGTAEAEPARETRGGVVQAGAAGQRVDEVPRRVHLAAYPLGESAPLHLVGPLRRDDVDDAAGGATELGGELMRQDHGLLDDLLGEEGVEGRAAGQVVVVETIHQVRVGAPRLAVDHQHRAALPEEAARRGGEDRGVDERQIGEGPAVERQRVDLARRKTQLAAGPIRIEERRFPRDDDPLAEGRADLEVE